MNQNVIFATNLHATYAKHWLPNEWRANIDIQ
jgi:hypothetical protein